MMLPLLVGLGLGGVGVLMMYRVGLLAERSGMAVLVSAVAVFYPVFAVASNASIGVIVLHLAVFAAFTAAAAWGFHAGAGALAGLLVLHGLFDAAAIFLTSPAPSWWPAFCAGIDIAAGACVFALLYRKDIPA